jgi:hypothetical protein
MLADSNSASSSKYLFSCSLRLFSVLLHKENLIRVHLYHIISFSDQAVNVYRFREILIITENIKLSLFGGSQL